MLSEEKELINKIFIDSVIEVCNEEIKEKLDANLVLKYAVENYKLDINKYEITRDNRIDNIKNPIPERPLLIAMKLTTNAKITQNITISIYKYSLK